MFYFRKITRAKWEKNPKNDQGVISAEDPTGDAITGCTRTHDNTLSLWHIQDETQKEVNKAILALACGMNKCESFDYVVLPKNAVDAVFKIEKTLQTGAFKEMNEFHYDIVGVKHSTLKIISELIINGINDKKAKKVSAGQLREIFQNAVDEKRLEKSDLNESLRQALWPQDFK